MMKNVLLTEHETVGGARGNVTCFRRAECSVPLNYKVGEKNVNNEAGGG